MNAESRDTIAVQALRTLEVASYLRARGWTQQKSSTATNSSVWTSTVQGEEFEVIVPLDQDIRDFALRMGEVLHTLAVAENRSRAQVYADLLTTFADVVRIRIDDPEMQDGTLPIDSYAQVATKTRDLILAAACSATEHRSVWPSKKPAKAVEFVRNLRSGQTERGSYIVTIISRVPPALHVVNAEHFFEKDIPFERLVIQALANSLKCLNHAAAEAAQTGEYAAFDLSVNEGVSANLCDAVAGLWGSDNSQRTIEFAFSWSPARPIDDATPSHVKFSADRIPFIRTAAKTMRDKAPIPEYELEGVVVKLDRQVGQTVGKVTILGQVDGSSKRVSLELGDPLYHLAVQSHDERKVLRCLGSLVREGRLFVLQEPREFALSDE